MASQTGGQTAQAKRRPERSRDTRVRFEQWAKNPQCEANTLSAVHNVKMAKVAEHAGVDPSFGASPFALFRGDQFERNLLNKDAERLIPELIRTGVLPEGSAGLHDLRIRMNAGTDTSLVDLDTACDRTLDLLRRIGRARGSEIERLEPVVAGATVILPRGVMLPEALLIIDVLAVRRAPGTDRAEIAVGEIKTYPDRGGHTDRLQLAQARAQLGLYLHALRTVTADFAHDELPVFSELGFLVLSRPGSDFPRVRAGEELRHQASRAARGFDLLEELAQRLPKSFDPDLDDDPTRMAAVLHAKTRYSEACLAFCDLAPKCHQEALDASDPVVLGDDVRRFVGGLPLSRIGELLDGAAPVDETERELIDRIHSAEDPGWD
jgi:hypothetical protein